MSARPEALAAVRAAKNLKNWGPWAAFRYAQKRGVSLRMYWIACLFEARRSAAPQNRVVSIYSV